ncbi:GIY-YIG nuclease family protein [Klebsiella sp. BIGb0407]|uniref:GIY-YIG nuclease family protein n=1 Tax=Klebsiella sp. BIGb0407 TaxID=2940603 RepID=UPI0021699DF3|nr:GIY-YIG nuclease family protein [Klebsiella sp. BIGb0407]MCS3433284.1 putative endonuclease [Klebsiella sp. BIGb0407]
MTSWYLYLIRSQDNRLYTGITTDVSRRFAEHQAGKGAKALRGRGTLLLVFSQEMGNRSQALRVEYQVKQLSKIQKERLVSQVVSLNDLIKMPG